MVNFVEAIEDGRIVKVTEDYARREGLLIIRRQAGSDDGNASSNFGGFSQKSAIGGSGSGISGIVNRGRMIRRDFKMETLRKPLHYYKNEVISDLIDNFHWEILRIRKLKSITRKQLAKMTGESEETIKMIENAILPHDNYILINKIQSALGINLRREGKKYEAPKINRTLAAAKEPRWMRKRSEKPFVEDALGESEGLDIDMSGDKKDEELVGKDVEVVDEDAQK